MSATACKSGVSGVPFTVINGQWAVSGCQEPAVFMKVGVHVLREVHGRILCVFLRQIFEQLAHSSAPNVEAPTPGETCPPTTNASGETTAPIPNAEDLCPSMKQIKAETTEANALVC